MQTMKIICFGMVEEKLEELRARENDLREAIGTEGEQAAQMALRRVIAELNTLL